MAIFQAATPPASSVDPITPRRRGAGLIAHDPALAGEGYTLIAPQTGDGDVYLIAMDGTIAHRWKILPRWQG